MSLRHPKASGADHRRWVRILLTSGAVVLILAPGIAGAGAGTGGATDDDAQMVADAKLAESAIVAGYNDKKWESNTSRVSVTLPGRSTTAWCTFV